MSVPNRVPALARLRRALNKKVSVEALLEAALWLAVPYLVVGITWAFTHPDTVQELQTQWNTVLPAGADIAAFGQTAALWPAILLLPTRCPGPV